MKKGAKAILTRLKIWALSTNAFWLKGFYKWCWKPKPNSLEEKLDQLSRNAHGHIRFIQVGSNDGFRNDPICKFIKRDRWQGVLTEPQTSVFPILQRIYRKNAVDLLNKAVDDQDLPKTLYYISISQARWAHGLSTFVREHLEHQIATGYVEAKARKEGIQSLPAKDQWIGEQQVPCITFKQILESPKLAGELDLLMIDTEGYDLEILRMFPFHQVRPRCVVFEMVNLSPDNQVESQTLLENYGYVFKKIPPDGIAYLPDSL